ncbi:MAG TPA: nucleotidyltransferase family protein, partial [Thermoanaerobaculia bacterium]|nr:nucleotidyltransferase family protein [Thermoanaerobaculia bacterium]
MSRARRAVVLARGLGTRMRRPDGTAALDPAQAAAAASGVKAMISFGAGRPFLDYVLSGLADARIDEACLVIGPEHDEI